ncbi:MAG: hypothetical protein NT031_13240 [Planctomycetota bacterium]|nr:hypothetical protein [Planctomycetota bacterium]
MNEASIRGKVEELLQMVGHPAPNGKADDGVYVSVETDSAEPTAEGLDRLRLQVKYLVFDLEATRRENRYLRMMLDSRNRRPKKDAEDNELDQF